MKSWNKQTSLLRVTTLAAALMGVYGVAGAVPAPPLECLSASQCTEGPYDDELYLQDSSSGVKGAVHGSNGAEFSVEGSKIVGHNKARGVLADNGANITLEGVTITTNGGSGHGVQSHQTNTSLPSSQITINNSTVIAKSVDYAVGILAQKGTLISGTAVDVETNGTNGSGVEADRGGRIELWGAEDLNSIVASGAGAAGARAISGKEADAIPGSIALDKYYVESEHGVGLMAGDEDGPGGPVTAGIITFTNGQVLASGAGSSSTHMGAAARVKHGSTLLVEQSDLVSVQHHGVVVDESSALLKDTNVITSGIGGGSGSLVAGVLASNKANVLIRNGNIVANGEQYTRGVLATSGANVDIDGTTIATLGAHSHAVHAWGDGVSDAPQVLVTNAKIGTTKRESYGLSAQNAGEITARNTAINTQGEGGFGAFAYNGGRLDITGGSITTHGTSSFEHPELGVEVGNYGVLAKNKSTAIITGTKVSTKGAHAEGLRAENDGAEGDVYNTSSTISAQGVTVDTAGLEAHGIAAYGSAHEDDEWAQGSTVDFKEGAIHTAGGQAVGALASSGGVVLLKDARITTSGEGGHGAVAFTDTFGMLAKAAAPMAYSPSTVVLNNVDIETSGAVAVGLVAFNGDSNIQMTGGSIKAKGDGSAGLFLGNDAEVSLDGVTVESDGASILSYFGADEDVSQLASDLEQVIDVKDSVFALNNSTLLRVDRKEGGEDGVVYLDLRGNTVAIGNIENYGADGKLGSSKNTHVTLYDSASWVGVGMDDKTTIAKSGDTVTGSQAGNVTAPDGSSVSFQNVPSIAGSVSATLGSIFSFAGSPTTIEGGLFGMPQSNVTFNNDVHILGQGTGQQGGFALNGVGSIFAFSGNTTIDGPVQGDGSSFNFTGASTNIGALNLQNGSSISGGTGGNPINVQGNTGIAGGSTLGGNLNIQGQLSSADSFIAPGNSIGTISVDTLGSVSGSVFEFEVDGNGQADLLVVRNGDANLKGSSLKVDRYEGYRLDHDYTIIRTEAGNVVNEFDSEQLGDTFSGTLVKLDPVKYGSNDVKVSLSVDGNAIDRTGYSANQSATLDGALSVAGRNASADAVMFMQPDARKDALNQLSGELHGSTQAALLQSSSLVSRTLTQRLRANLGAGMLPGAPTAQAGGSVAGAMPTSAAYPLWAQVVGNWSTLDSDGNAAQVKTDTAGLFIGGDTEVGAGWRVGGALGYTDGRIKVDERDSKSDVSTFTAALYGGNSWKQGNGTLNFLAGAAYSHHDIDSRRTVNVGGSQTLKADYRAHTTQLFTELGYAVPVGQRSVVEPYLGLAWLSQKAKGFTEEGGAAALQGESQKDDVTTFTLGLRGKTALEVGAHPAHVFAGLGWRHASGDVDPGRRVSFVQGGGAAFNVAGAPIAKNAAVVDLGVEMAVGRNTAMGLGYSGQYGNDNTDHSGQLYLRSRF